MPLRKVTNSLKAELSILRRRAAYIGLLVIFIVLITEFILEKYFKEADIQNKQLQVTQQLTGLSSRLSGLINSNLFLLSGLSAHIGMKPDITQAEFEAYASSIFRQEPLLVNMAAARDLIITHIYPIETNRAALGLNYRLTDTQWNAVKMLDKRGEMVVAGPLDMVQGGEAIIGRVTVFTGDDQFWGITSAPIYTQKLYQAAGLLNEDLSIKIAIRGKDGYGRNGDVFYGDEALFNDQRSITTTLDVGSGSWLLAAQPRSGWEDASGTIWLLRISFTVLALLLTIIIGYRYRQFYNEKNFRQTIEKNQALLQEVSKIALVGGWQITPEKNQLRFTLWNDQTAKVFGIKVDSQNPLTEEVLTQLDKTQANQLRAYITNATLGHTFDTELQVSSTSGRWIRIIGKPIETSEPPFSVLGSVQDITERKRFTDKIQHQAIYDQLTGLPNRLLFNNRLNKTLTKCHRDKQKVAVLFIDLDHFKPVNDNLGHNAGDLLLKEVGHRIKHCIRQSDTVARYSGDEFIVILNDIKETKVPVSIAQNIIDAISAPFTLDKHKVYCGASIGISMFPDDGNTVEDLVSNADQAMYEVKRNGRNGWQFFTKTMQVISEKRHSLSNKLVHAIQNNEFSVVYQPIIDLTENKIKKCEALVRWNHNGEWIPTDEFISLAEETGRINEIDRFVLQASSHYINTLSKKFDYPIALSINVSPRVFSSKDNALDQWLALLTRASQHLDITVEITERLLIEESDRIMWVLTRIKSLGVTIAIDDFGTGYSSLSYLTKFPIDIIKIDQSFIKKLGDVRIPEALTESMIALSHKLSLEVVAEGVETTQQLTMLKGWNCDYGQGYYFAKPLSEKDFSQCIQSQVEALQI
ncbi:EAL domain-containing protein [Gilvimarinus chinensis]|uniref:EAL domain-containing protein n=1 Tax=Gilvimarinus chinensis TaxID=396005 RepID=UPI000365E468|nr:EAL domain-containing protein [Gilvimarinus chinensis]